MVRVSASEVPALRRKPGPIPEGWTRTPASLLRYSDEQTVAGTAAVFAAMETMGRVPEEFAGWGVVAASRYLGRTSLAAALRSFLAEGVWGTSPHLIPHFALHSPSGTISLALGLHGPNLGVGGGLHAAAEGFLAALTWLAAGVVPGVWLVLSGWSPELVPDPAGRTVATGECRALALALVAVDEEGARRRPAVRIVVDPGAQPAMAPAPIDLIGLAESLATPGGPWPRMIATDVGGRLRVELLERSEGSG
ncbi:MAG TPA: hypothetical protein VFF52_11025 [Isosphaeraceae bacterium]|nr:hypothetical protein [Isosphaeraceae bacterium]